MESQHIVSSYDEELRKLDNMVLELGGLAEAQLADAITCLSRRDVEMAEQVVARDASLDAIENEIHTFTIRLLALRQPLARDLRIIVAALKISSYLERIGDLAKNIAKRTIAVARGPDVGDAARSIARMSSLVQVMIKNVLDAYIQRDKERAEDVRQSDHDVDQVYNSVFRELLTYMMEDPRNITASTHLLFMAKNVERMGDHVTGIAEQVHFMVAGELPQEARPKGDNTSYSAADQASNLSNGGERDT